MPAMRALVEGLGNTAAPAVCPHGSPLLMHVGAASQDAAALPDIIDGLRDLGYRFVTVNEMVGR